LSGRTRRQHHAGKALLVRALELVLAMQNSADGLEAAGKLNRLAPSLSAVVQPGIHHSGPPGFGMSFGAVTTPSMKGSRQTPTFATARVQRMKDTMQTTSGKEGWLAITTVARRSSKGSGHLETGGAHQRHDLDEHEP
jgi:hypothetical protein